nr:Hsp20/alpha crystallin family protein [Dyella sp. ASV24]
MANNMMQRSDWPDRLPATDPVKQLFDRVFDRHPRRGVSADDPTVLANSWIPSVDIKEEAQRFIIYVDAPGVAPDSVDVRMTKGLLTIKGKRKTESQDCRGSFTRVERRHGTFHRRFTLPASADPRGITVTARDGILYIIVRKHSSNASRQIWMAKEDADGHVLADSPFNAPWSMA